jgi:hypothetical protein
MEWSLTFRGLQKDSLLIIRIKGKDVRVRDR